MFEEVNGHKDCLQQCVTGMGGAFSKAQISRQLKSMGLKKNRLTPAQVCCTSPAWLSQGILCPAEHVHVATWHRKHTMPSTLFKHQLACMTVRKVPDK